MDPIRAPALRRSGRQRHVEERAAEIRAVLRADQLEAPAALAEAMGVSARALVAVVDTLAGEIATIEAELASRFDPHPDAKIIRPGQDSG